MVAIATIAAALLSPWAMAQTKAASYEGSPVRLGHGSAHTIVRTDAEGGLASIGVVFGAAALVGLPTPAAGASPNFPYLLPMPTTGPKTVVDHVVVNWESAGHPPPHVYDVQHFDFHFYFVSHEEQMRITFGSESESGDPGQQPPADLMPAGYVMPPGTAVAQMGAHAIDPKAPEFNGQPFTVTLIYGYYNKQQLFIEPMATLAFLRSKQSYSAPVVRPAAYTKTGAYPSSYSVKYDKRKKVYEVTLGELR
ncbi:DUF5602 domain-containing protein [Azoarcus sp. KH32C]|uniref:DUF5602 domain-containing protein n=1 Tax=Azoarcus sp. KH32C TaxID=748247 RepID=UPI0002385D3A|nr:DUF5602 domain-containing protein [Azoarcus sp. KH32C]BAL27008.1 hypothetical protein AZKH_p0125 [Azoarcus sp. KH32C]